MKYIKNKPLEKGDTRRLVKFAWLPTEVRYPPTNTTYVVWLEKYYENQRYTFKSDNGWPVSEWVTYDKWIS